MPSASGAAPDVRAWGARSPGRKTASIRPEAAFLLDEASDGGDAGAGAQIAEYEGPRPAHAPGVALHHIERSADMRRQIDLVDDQEVGARDAGAALGRDLVAGGDVGDVAR